ncbi:MAG: HlyD family efflux transporter periplasmic adaptor subunit [Chroococcidiopsidaceae cyanobacterium CP_BM_RX_35]|nr:HlyD family efflux transporter periplasmic adaptor subunit [Chroococcidiopsidaceae cyanobacterium CP_BM_RX_35]
MRLCLVLFVASEAGYLVWKHYTKVNSSQAFINAEIIDVGSPISGSLLLRNIQPGQWLRAGTIIGQVENKLKASELEVSQQELQSRLQLNQQKIADARQRIAERRQLLSQFSTEVQEQKKIDIVYAQEEMAEAQSELNKALLADKTNRVDANRYIRLVREGAIAQNVTDQAQLKADQADTDVNRTRSRLAQARQFLEAARAGLQVQGSRTLSYSEIRQRELQTEVADLQQQASDLQLQEQTLKVELTKLTQQLNLNQRVVLSAPTHGVVWSVDTKAGEYITPTTPVVKVLNCQNRWVEAFFPEASTRDLSAGMSAQVKLVGSDSQVLDGTIEAIRGGSGRVTTTGKDVAVPPPESVRRQVAVRIRVNWQDTPNSVQFCDVGRSAEVTFPRHSSFGSWW